MNRRIFVSICVALESKYNSCMDFFKPQTFPSSLITLVFIVPAVMVYENVGGIAGAVDAFGILVVWALVSFWIEKSFLKNPRASIWKYCAHAVGLTLFLLVTAYTLELVFGPLR